MIYFSCIVTCYNRQDLILRAINSILNQKHEHFEIVVVDDGSQDNSVSVINTITDNRVKLIRHQTNKGQNAAINTGLESSKYDYLAFLDSDDMWEPDFLLESSKVYEEFPSISFAYANRVNGYVWTLEGSSKYADVLNQGFLAQMSCFTAKKEAVEAAGKFDIRYRICQDDDFSFRMSKKFSFKALKKPMIHSLSSSNSVTNDTRALLLETEFLFKDYKDDIISYCGNKTYSRHMINLAVQFFRIGNFSKGFQCYSNSFFYFFKPGKSNFAFSLKDFRGTSWVIFKIHIKRLLNKND